LIPIAATRLGSPLNCPYAAMPCAGIGAYVYLWAFPMQQIVAAHFPTMDNLLGLCISVPMTIVAAMISWHLVEKPAIALGRKIANAIRPGRGGSVDTQTAP